MSSAPEAADLVNKRSGKNGEAQEPWFMLHHDGASVGEVQVENLNRLLAGEDARLELRPADRWAREWVDAWRASGSADARRLLIQDLWRDVWVRVDGATVAETDPLHGSVVLEAVSVVKLDT